MNAWQLMWRNLKRWLYRKRLFALDVKSFDTLRLVAEREKRSPEEVASQLFNQAARQQDDQAWAMRCWSQLSPRQMQIAAYICRGDTTRQIAAILQISQTTVKSHVEIILRKFDINSRVELRHLLAPWDLSDFL